MTFFGSPSPSHQSAHSFQYSWKMFVEEAHTAPATALQTEEPFSVQHTFLSSQRVKCSNCRPLRIQSTKTSMTRFFDDKTLMRNVLQQAENCGKSMSLHPTMCHKNKKSEQTCDILYQKYGQNYGNQCRRKHITHLKCPQVFKSIPPKSCWW